MFEGIKIYLKEIVFAIRDVRNNTDMINNNLCTNNELQREIFKKLEEIRLGKIK